MPRLSEDLYLVAQLYNRATNKYVRVKLIDASDNTELEDSPIDLTHVENGLYVDKSLKMPEVDKILAIYTVYSDAGHTTVDTSYETTHENILLEKSDARIDIIGYIETTNEIEGEI